MTEITCSEATFGCKSNDLSDWYQLYISCKINIETPITLSNRYETIRSVVVTLSFNAN